MEVVQASLDACVTGDSERPLNACVETLTESALEAAARSTPRSSINDRWGCSKGSDCGQGE